MENKKETVCAVVVTYNRKKLLLECLKEMRAVGEFTANLKNLIAF